MRYPRYVRWIVAGALAVALAACSADATATPVPEPTATPTPAGTPTPTVTPTPTLPEGAVTVNLRPSHDTTLYHIPPSQEVVLEGYDAASLANGAGEHLFVGLTNQPGKRRSLIAFDIAGTIPAGATVHSVELALTMSRTGVPFLVNPVRLHRATASWGEGATVATGNEGRGLAALPGDATWVYRSFDDQLWAAPGGDFSPIASATTEVSLEDPYTWGSTEEMVADVQAWLDDPSANHGWTLVGDEAERRSVKRFDSRERVDEEDRPNLTVVYIPR